jgi:exosome complex component RRP42
MASAQQVLRSPTELEVLHNNLSLAIPIRPDGRRPRDFRPITAEVGILPGTNGSARVFFADGTEAIVGVKAEVTRTEEDGRVDGDDDAGAGGRTGDDLDDGAGPQQRRAGRSDWVEVTVEIPGFRDDDPTTVFLASMLTEALVADKEFAKKLYINRRFHWRLYLDVSGGLQQAAVIENVRRRGKS